jgi:uncharacterized protein YndB with AHSA1/START domain
MDNDAITIAIAINAPIEKVWDAWTDAAVVCNWFGSDPRGAVLAAKLNVYPGGSYEISFRDEDHTEHTCSGMYVDVQEHSKLTFTWTWKSEPAVTSFVTVALRAKDNGTLMQFEHRDIGTASAHNYLNGWKATFSKLEQLLAGKNNTFHTGSH